MSTRDAVKPRMEGSDPGNAMMRLPFLSSSAVAESATTPPGPANQALLLCRHSGMVSQDEGRLAGRTDARHLLDARPVFF